MDKHTVQDVPASPDEASAAASLGLPLRAVLTSRAEAVCELLFQAQAITNVTAAALVSEAPPDAHTMRQALDVVWDILDTAASQIEPGALMRTGGAS